MGITWSGYAAIVFTASPPQSLRARSEDGRSGRWFFTAVVGSITVFFALGVVAALLADAAIEGVGGNYAVIASGPYASLVLVLAMVVGLPLMTLMRDRVWHVAIWLLMALGVYGILVPNLVLALQNR